MQKRKRPKTWTPCPVCHMLVFSNDGVGNHRCPEKVLEIRDEELDLVVEVEMETWDQEVSKFWNSKDVKWYVYLASSGRL